MNRCPLRVENLAAADVCTRGCLQVTAAIGPSQECERERERERRDGALTCPVVRFTHQPLQQQSLPMTEVKTGHGLSTPSTVKSIKDSCLSTMPLIVIYFIPHARVCVCVCVCVCIPATGGDCTATNIWSMSRLAPTPPRGGFGGRIALCIVPRDGAHWQMI